MARPSKRRERHMNKKIGIGAQRPTGGKGWAIHAPGTGILLWTCYPSKGGAGSECIGRFVDWFKNLQPDSLASRSDEAAWKHAQSVGYKCVPVAVSEIVPSLKAGRPERTDHGIFIPLTEKLQVLVLGAVKMTGSYKFNDVEPYIGESLTLDETKSIEAFLGWVCKKKLNFGSANLSGTWRDWGQSLTPPTLALKGRR